MSETRTEHDSMGEIAVPMWAQWGAQTQRAFDNVQLTGRPIDLRVVWSLALIKGEAAKVNAVLPEVPAVTPEIAEAIVVAAKTVVGGHHDDQFPLEAFQTGSGTSTNMNVNEVLANLASQRLGRAGAVHPNDHVNASQSSNDVFPTAVQIALSLAVKHELVPALDRLSVAFRSRARDTVEVVKSGRTHLMDAVPITLGQEFDGWATQVDLAAERCRGALKPLGVLPLGGTAVGTGLNAPYDFAPAVIAALAAVTGLPLAEADDHVAAQSNRDVLVELSGRLRTVAAALNKLANDLRWMASGPATGLGELRLPALQPGSSIMPGKVNPVVPEVVAQVVARVIGLDATVAYAGTQSSFELNTYQPVMADDLLAMVQLLAGASTLLVPCVMGAEPQLDRLAANAEASPAVATALNPLLGYELVAELVATAARTGTSMRSLVLERGLVPADELDRVLDLAAMTRGGVRDGKA